MTPLGFSVSPRGSGCRGLAGTGRDEAQPRWESIRSSLYGREPPKARALWQCSSSQLCLCFLWRCDLQSQASKTYCQTETELANEQMWGSSLACFKREGPKLRNHCQLAVRGLPPNRRASPDLSSCRAQL